MSDLARFIRRDALEQIYTAGSGHPGGSLSIADILAVLYGEVMQPQPYRFTPDRDILVLSKGHACPALYAALKAIGVKVGPLRKPGSSGQGHPALSWLPEVETSTGSLGQGFAVAVGLALALKDSGRRVYCILGDGECHEGIVVEAARFAAYNKLSNLVAVVDCNQLQSDSHSAMMVNLFAEFSQGWRCLTINGHDQAMLSLGLKIEYYKPVAIIANTTKGRGVSFMENRPEWHGSVTMTDEQLEQALGEL